MTTDYNQGTLNTRYNKGAKKSHCPHGHSLDDAYLVPHKVRGKMYTMRICKQCQKERNIRYKERKLRNNN